MKFFAKVTACVFFFSVTTLSTTAIAQDIRIGINAGYNSYNLGSLKQFERNISGQFNWRPSLAVTESFPPYFNYGFALTTKTERFIFGSHYNFHSTGSRYHYADYSGETGFDTVLKGHFIGISAAFKIRSFRNGNYQLYGGIAPNIVFGTYNVDEYLRLSGLNSKNNTSFTTRGYNTEIFLKGEYELKRVIFSLKTGFDISLRSKMYFEDQEVSLNGTYGGNSEVEWSGFRSNLGIHLKLGK